MPSHVAVSRKRGMSDIGLILHDERHIALKEYAPHHSASSSNCSNPRIINKIIPRIPKSYTANILTVLSTDFGSVTCATVIWLHILQPKIAIDLKLYSSVSLNVMSIVVACNNHCQITGHT